MSNTSQDPACSLNGARRGISLVLLPATSPVALVPAWAVLCGAWAARGEGWPTQVTLDPQAWIALALAMFVVQILWSTGQELLIGNAQKHDLETGFLDPSPPSRPKLTAPTLPYTSPWSPLGRLIRRWHTASMPESVRLTLLLVPLLATILSALIGWPMVLLSLAAAALTCIERRIVLRKGTARALEAGTLVGLGWLAGHTLFAPLAWTSLTAACCFAIAYQGALVLERDTAFQRADPVSGKRDPVLWALALLYGGQAAAFVLLVVLGRPLAATLLGVLLAPQWLLLALLETRTCSSYVQRAIPFVTIAMLVTAWAIPA